MLLYFWHNVMIWHNFIALRMFSTSFCCCNIILSIQTVLLCSICHLLQKKRYSGLHSVTSMHVFHSASLQHSSAKRRSNFLFPVNIIIAVWPESCREDLFILAWCATSGHRHRNWKSQVLSKQALQVGVLTCPLWLDGLLAKITRGSPCSA